MKKIMTGKHQGAFAIEFVIVTMLLGVAIAGIWKVMEGPVNKEISRIYSYITNNNITWG